MSQVGNNHDCWHNSHCFNIHCEFQQIFITSVNNYSSQVWTNIHYECEQIQMSLDRLELSVDGGRVKIFIQIGHYDKTLIIGQVNMIGHFDHGDEFVFF